LRSIGGQISIILPATRPEWVRSRVLVGAGLEFFPACSSQATCEGHKIVLLQLQIRKR
jgi:hypothetical protein